jgi:hypothetical protein
LQKLIDIPEIVGTNEKYMPSYGSSNFKPGKEMFSMEFPES